MFRSDDVRAIADAPVHAAGPSWPRRALVVALLLSLAAHLAVSTWIPPSDPAPEDRPLTASITELPPPPAPVAAPVVAPTAPPSRPAAKPRSPRPPVPRPSAPDIVVAPAEADGAPGDVAGADANARGAAPAAPPTAAPEPPVGTAVDALPAKTLPPRVDLAYKVFVGTRGFQVGEATYRFEHQGQHYRISTVAQARGLAALLLRGQGRLESTGLITPQGLQPIELVADRFNNRGRETARFDWEAGMLRLAGDKALPLDAPTFDPLTLMWQYYFTPPKDDRILVSVATTRRIARYTLTREGTEEVEWGRGSVLAERWVRVSDDGAIEAHAWLAPELRHIPVKMRVTSTARGTLEAVLDAILVDETGETVGRDDIVLRASPPSPTHDRASPEAMPGYSPPGATFPSMTP